MKKPKFFTKTSSWGKFLASWAVFLFAFGTGSLAADMWIGDGAQMALHKLPHGWSWVPAGLVAVGAAILLLDLIFDLEPNMPSVYAVLIGPSIATAVNGKVSDTVTAWSGWIISHIRGDMEDWIGTASTSGLALIGIALTIAVSRKVVKRGKSAKAAETAEA